MQESSEIMLDFLSLYIPVDEPPRSTLCNIFDNKNTKTLKTVRIHFNTGCPIPIAVYIFNSNTITGHLGWTSSGWTALFGQLPCLTFSRKDQTFINPIKALILWLCPLYWYMRVKLWFLVYLKLQEIHAGSLRSHFQASDSDSIMG